MCASMVYACIIYEYKNTNFLIVFCYKRIAQKTKRGGKYEIHFQVDAYRYFRQVGRKWRILDINL